MSNSNLSSEQKRWLLKGEEAEVREEFEKLQREYDNLVTELRGLKPSYHYKKCEAGKGGVVTTIFNSYEKINTLLSKIEDSVRKIKIVDDKLEKINENYIKAKDMDKVIDAVKPYIKSEA